MEEEECNNVRDTTTSLRRLVAQRDQTMDKLNLAIEDVVASLAAAGVHIYASAPLAGVLDPATEYTHVKFDRCDTTWSLLAARADGDCLLVRAPMDVRRRAVAVLPVLLESMAVKAAAEVRMAQDALAAATAFASALRASARGA